MRSPSVAHNLLRSSVWADTLIFPCYAAALSALLLLWQCIAGKSGKGIADAHPRQSESRFRRKIHEAGGGTIFAFRLVQVLAVFALLGMSIAQLVMPLQMEKRHSPSASVTVQIAQCALYVRFFLLHLHPGGSSQADALIGLSVFSGTSLALRRPLCQWERVHAQLMDPSARLVCIPLPRHMATGNHRPGSRRCR